MTPETGKAPEVPAWTLGDRMGKALAHADIGMQEMADYLGVSRNSVSNWIHGRVHPSRQTLLLWSLRTGVALDWITQDEPLRAPASRNRVLRFLPHYRRAKRADRRVPVAHHSPSPASDHSPEVGRGSHIGSPRIAGDILIGA